MMLDEFYKAMKTKHGIDKEEADKILENLDVDDPMIERLLSALEKFFEKYE